MTPIARMIAIPSRPVRGLFWASKEACVNRDRNIALGSAIQLLRSFTLRGAVKHPRATRRTPRRYGLSGQALMDAARRQGHLYFLRFLVVCFALPGLAAAPFGIAALFGLPAIYGLLAMPISLLLWALLSRRLLVHYRAKCPACGRAEARLDAIKSRLHLRCSACGHSADCHYEWSDAGG